MEGGRCYLVSAFHSTPGRHVELYDFVTGKLDRAVLTKYLIY